MQLIEAVAKAFKSILTRPLLLLPALVVPIVLFALLFVLQGPLFNFLVEVLFLGNIPETSVAAFPVYFVAMYPVELLAITILFFVSSVLSIGLAFFYARAANDFEAGSASIGKALNAALAEKGSVFVLSVFLFVAMAFLLALAWILLVISTFNALLGFVLVLALALLVFYAFVRLAFTVPAMAVESLKAKEALAKSWFFTEKRFFGALVFLVAVMLVYSVILGFGDFADNLLYNELFGAIVFVAFWAVAIAFANLAIAFYYIRNSAVTK